MLQVRGIVNVTIHTAVRCDFSHEREIFRGFKAGVLEGLTPSPGLDRCEILRSTRIPRYNLERHFQTTAVSAGWAWHT